MQENEYKKFIHNLFVCKQQIAIKYAHEKFEKIFYVIPNAPARV